MFATLKFYAVSAFILILLWLYFKAKFSSLFYKIDYLVGCFIGLFVYTPLFASRAEHFLIFPYWPRAGIFFHVLTAYFSINVIIAWILLVREYFVGGDKLIRSRIIIILVGTIFAFLGGSINYLPWYIIPVLPITTVLSSVWIIFSIYAIIRYRFMEIDTVIHRTELWLITL